MKFVPNYCGFVRRGANRKEDARGHEFLFGDDGDEDVGEVGVAALVHLRKRERLARVRGVGVGGDDPAAGQTEEILPLAARLSGDREFVLSGRNDADTSRCRSHDV